MKKKVLIIVALVFAFIIVIALTAVDTSMENSVKVTGTIESVYEGGVKDVVFELEGDKNSYYINRGFENGFELTKAKKDFEGKKIKLFYAKSWTPLAPFGRRCKHITHAAVDDNVIFSEWEK